MENSNHYSGIPGAFDLFPNGEVVEIKSLRPVWEYTYEPYESKLTSDIDSAVVVFNEMGAEGWELTHVDVVEVGRFSTKYRAIFKRQKWVEDDQRSE